MFHLRRSRNRFLHPRIYWSLYRRSICVLSTHIQGCYKGGSYGHWIVRPHRSHIRRIQSRSMLIRRNGFWDIRVNWWASVWSYHSSWIVRKLFLISLTTFPQFLFSVCIPTPVSDFADSFWILNTQVGFVAVRGKSEFTLIVSKFTVGSLTVFTVRTHFSFFKIYLLSEFVRSVREITIGSFSTDTVHKLRTQLSFSESIGILRFLYFLLSLNIWHQL